MEQIPPGSFCILVLQSGRPRKRNPSCGKPRGPAEPFGQDPQFCSSSRLTSEILSTGRAQAPFRQR